MQLSKYFTLQELIFSDTAVRKGIDNNPSSDVVLDNLKSLCTNVLDPVRELIGKPIHVNSGFRTYRLNSLVGGNVNSQHTKGEAADIICPGISVEELYTRIKNSGILFDQLIQEHDNWVHISYKANGAQRSECLRAYYLQGKVIYKPDR